MCLAKITRLNQSQSASEPNVTLRLTFPEGSWPQERVGLRYLPTFFGACLPIGEPARVIIEGGTAGVAVGGVFVSPEMDVGVDIACFCQAIEQRIAQMPTLYVIAVLGV